MLLSVGELVADDEWQIINDSEHYPQEDYSTPEQQTDLEQSEIERRKDTNLRILEWMRDVKSRRDEEQSIQQVDVSAAKQVKTKDPFFIRTATDRRLEIPPDNLDLASSTGTMMLNVILQLEAQGECMESVIEAVLMVGYTTEGISNQEQTKWLSWNVDRGVRGFDLARNPGLSNNTEYGAAEFPLPTRPPARSAGQSTSKPPSIIRSQQTEEIYPDLSNLKRELERAQRERDKANLAGDGAKLERDQASLDRDQAILERDQARRDLILMRTEYQQEQKVRENEANCEQLKSEIEKIPNKVRETKGKGNQDHRTSSCRVEARFADGGG